MPAEGTQPAADESADETGRDLERDLGDSSKVEGSGGGGGEAAQTRWVRLAEQLRAGLVASIEQLGGDVHQAVEASQKYQRLPSWVRDNLLRTALAGGGMSAVPGLHLGAVAIDFAYLLRRMAILGWGTGAMLGVPVHARPDLEGMLSRFSGGEHHGSDVGLAAALLDGPSRVSVKTILREQGIEVVDELVAESLARAITLHEHGLSMELVAEELEAWVPDKLGVKFGGKKAGAKALAKGSEKIVAKGMGKLGTKWFMKSSAKLGGKFAEKLALKLAKKISPKLALKLGSGSVLLVGAGVSAGVNAWIIREFARAAEAYYREELALMAPTQPLALPETVP